MSLNFNTVPSTQADLQQQKKALSETKHNIAAELVQARLFQRLDKDELFRQVFLDGWIGKNIEVLDTLLDDCPPDQLLTVRAQRKQMKLMKQELENFMQGSAGKIEELLQTLAEIEGQENLANPQ